MPQEGEAGGNRATDEWEVARWARVMGLMVVMICTVGLQYTYAILLVSFRSALPSAPFAVLVAVGSVSNGVMELSAVASGAVMLRWGESRTCMCGGLLAGVGFLLSSFASESWHLVVCYGLVVGFGQSLSLFSAVIMLNKVFSKRRSLAAGIGCSGGGIGTLLFGVAIPQLLVAVGHSWTLRILAAVVSVCCCLAGSILTDPFSEPVRTGRVVRGEAEAQSSWRSATGSWSVRLCCGGLFTAACGLFLPIVTLVEFAVQNGWQLHEGSMLVSFVGVGGLSLRIPASAVADITGPQAALVTILYLDGVIMVCAGVGFLLHVYSALVVYAVAFGGLLGCFLTITSPMMAAMVEPEHMTRVTTLAFTCVGCGFMAGPAIAVALFPNLNHAVLFSGVLVLLGGLIVNLSITTGGPRCTSQQRGRLQNAPAGTGMSADTGMSASGHSPGAGAM